MPYGIIYKATNLINGKCYIGQTKRSLEERKKSHFVDCFNKSYKSIFHNAIRKYGKENFEWEVVCECSSKSELREKEMKYIKENNSFSHSYNSNGYNLTLGGDGLSGHKHSDETKEKCRRSHLGKKTGPFSKMARKNMSDAHKGIKLNFTEEHKRRISESKKGKGTGKIYEVITLGKKIIIDCLKHFCYENDLIYENVRYAMNNNKWYKNYYFKELQK